MSVFIEREAVRVLKGEQTTTVFFSVLLRMTMRLRLKNIEVRKKHRHKQHHTF